jgi:hypothetical protein
MVRDIITSLRSVKGRVNPTNRFHARTSIVSLYKKGNIKWRQKDQIIHPKYPIIVSTVIINNPQIKTIIYLGFSQPLSFSRNGTG